MQYRTMGRTGVRISEIGFGAWGIGGDWGGVDDAKSIAAIHRALDLGVNFIDTALVYGDGHSEEVVGRAIRGRGGVLIASKVPPKSYRWPVLPHEPIDQTFPADWIIQCTETSLKNLGVDHLDFQQLHSWTPSYLQRDEWLAAVEKLKQQGKIRFFGISANDWDPYGPTSLIESGLIDTVQVIYNIFEQRPVEQLLPAAQKHDVGIIVRVPFEEGLLTGRMGPDYEFEPGDWRAEWLTPDRLAEAQQRVERLRPFLNDDRPTFAALALKFSLSHPAVSTVIPGMRSIRHVEENCAVSDGKLLSEAERQALRAHQFVHGWSYPWSQAK